ncbi:hypothetical protein AB0L05_41615 [Nonomuraea pusilla]|uniref:hypothetical protein n=1 Tax=Nonomuraea pusilla TaxID=46177 RepID=UPI00331F4864
MNLGPYTYVTLSMAPEEPPHLNVAFHTCDISVNARMLDDRRPYLRFSTPEANVSISTTGSGAVTGKDVATAREIYQAAAQYLADCERLHDRQPDAGRTSAA